MWRCTSNPLSYCKGEPDWDKMPMEIEKKDLQGNVVGKDLVGGTCKLDPKTCGRYSSSMGNYPHIEGHYCHKVVAENTEKATGMVEKKKSRVKPKVEEDTSQGKLLL